MQSSFTHAVAGCASASIGGGSCGRGALAAGFADYYRGQLAANNTASESNFIKSLERGASSGENTTLDGGSFGRAFNEARAAVSAYVMGVRIGNQSSSLPPAPEEIRTMMNDCNFNYSCVDRVAGMARGAGMTSLPDLGQVLTDFYLQYSTLALRIFTPAGRFLDDGATLVRGGLRVPAQLRRWLRVTRSRPTQAYWSQRTCA